jgi:periplasmic divalent cation tolerance protein
LAIISREICVTDHRLIKGCGHKGGAVRGIIQISTTSDNKEFLEEIARSLLQQKLASCVQIVGPIRSLYRWKGHIVEADEWLGIIKTRKTLYKKVEGEIRARHHYELPEIIAFEADLCLPAYGRWVIDETAETINDGTQIQNYS